MIRLNKSDYRLILTYFVIASIWLSFKFRSEGISYIEITIDILVFWAKVITSFFYFKFLVERFILSSKRYFLFFVLLFIGIITIGIVAHLLGIWSEGSRVIESIYPLSELVIKGFYAVGADLTLFLGIIFSKKYYDQQLDNKDLQLINQKNKMSLLRLQFNPHFLFNNLNTIDSLIETNSEMAKEYIKHLATLYRLLLSNSDKELTSVENELSFMNSYIYLLETRFIDQFKFHVTINQKLDNFYLPVGSIQTLIENVMKHNRPVENTIIDVNINVANDRVIVRNSKGLRNLKPTSKLGLASLKLRYENYTNQKIVILDNKDAYQVELPLIKVKNS